MAGCVEAYTQNHRPLIIATLFCNIRWKTLSWSDLVQDLPVFTDMHVPNPVPMLIVLQLLVLDLRQLLQILCLFYSLCISLQGANYFIKWMQITLPNCLSVKPVVPKLFQAVTQIKVAIMSYYPQYFAVVAHNTEQHCGFGCALPRKKSHITAGDNLPYFGSHWVKCHNRIFT